MKLPPEQPTKVGPADDTKNAPSKLPVVIGIALQLAGWAVWIIHGYRDCWPVALGLWLSGFLIAIGNLWWSPGSLARGGFAIGVLTTPIVLWIWYWSSFDRGHY